MENSYSRQKPSARYNELISLYRRMHEQGDPRNQIRAENTFSGVSLLPQIARIKALIDQFDVSTLLDYGCGKADYYDRKIVEIEPGREESIVDYWELLRLECYDPAYEPYSQLPEQTSGGVICTDVLEHCPEDDVPWILDEIFGYAENFVFLTIASFPAKKTLPNGENAHITVHPADWWLRKIEDASSRHQKVLWEAWVTRMLSGSDEPNNGVEKCLEETRLGSFSPIRHVEHGAQAYKQR